MVAPPLDWLTHKPRTDNLVYKGDGIVIGSYTDLFGGRVSDDCEPDYEIFFKGRGRMAWTSEHRMTLVAADQAALLQQWEAELEARQDMESELPWIVANWQRFKTDGFPGPSLAALGKLIGIDNMWGSRGEGLQWYANAREIMDAFDKVMETQDVGKVLYYVQFVDTPKKRMMHRVLVQQLEAVDKADAAVAEDNLRSL